MMAGAREREGHCTARTTFAQCSRKGGGVVGIRGFAGSVAIAGVCVSCRATMVDYAAETEAKERGTSGRYAEQETPPTRTTSLGRDGGATTGANGKSDSRGPKRPERKTDNKADCRVGDENRGKRSTSPETSEEVRKMRETRRRAQKARQEKRQGKEAERATTAEAKNEKTGNTTATAMINHQQPPRGGRRQ